MAFLNALFTAVLDNNLVFAQMIGMVAAIAAACRPQGAFRLAGTLGLVAFVAAAVGWPLYSGLLLPWGISYLAPVAYMLVGAATAYVAATVSGRGEPGHTRNRLLAESALAGVCAVSVGAPLMNEAALATASARKGLPLDAALGTAVGAGFGVFLAVVLFVFARSRVDDRLVPKAMRGLPISIVTASLMALAFTGVAGVAAGLFA